MGDGLTGNVAETSLLFSDLAFPESPRWHAGQWWFVDMHRGDLWALDPSGEATLVLAWGSAIGGIAWLPEGDLLFVDKRKRALMRRQADTGETEMYADLSALTQSYCNDMLMLPDSSVLVGTYGFNPALGEPFKKGELLAVDPEGRPHVAAEGLSFPNGMALGAGGTRLVVAETVASRLVEYTVGLSHGPLQNRRTLAKFEQYTPDGICMDALGNVWLAPLTDRTLVQVNCAGEVIRRINTQGFPLACALGGESQQTLLITSVGIPLHKMGAEDYCTSGHGLVEVIDLEA